jgi:CheY-like chemotaxis protein
MGFAMLAVFFVLAILADLAVRMSLRRIRDNKRRRECEEALAVSLKLDYTHEAKTLVRAEVKDPAACILCVDDEDVILDSFRKVLVPAGFSVDTVRTGQEALGLIQTRAYDFVFTDLRMPAMDGVDVVKSVKHMRPDMDVIVITGFATVETAVECMKFGAMDYVQKPFTESELLDFAKKVTIQRRARLQKLLLPDVEILHLADPDCIQTRGFSIPGGVLIARGHSWASLLPGGAIRVGIDDFARKLIGTVEAVEFPEVGMTVQAGQPVFAVRQKGRVARFPAPVSGRISRVNSEISGKCGELDRSPYGLNWICEMECDALDTEMPALKIGKAAVALVHEDIESAVEFLRGAAKPGESGEWGGIPFAVGALGQLTDAQWEKAVQKFFAGSGSLK